MNNDKINTSETILGSQSAVEGSLVKSGAVTSLLIAKRHKNVAK